jgi:hypothetical protein
MNAMRRSAALVTTACAAILALPAGAAAQVPAGPVLSATAGVMQYDLAGTGSRAFAGARAQIPLTALLLVDLGAIYINYRPHGEAEAPRSHIWFPEVQLQVVTAFGAVRPYLGAGAGVALESVAGERFTEATLSGAVGARLPIMDRIVGGAEVRIRAVNPFVGTTADFGVSFGVRL